MVVIRRLIVASLFIAPSAFGSAEDNVPNVCSRFLAPDSLVELSNLLAEGIGSGSKSIRDAMMKVMPQTSHERGRLLSRAFGEEIASQVPLHDSAELFSHKLIEVLRAQRLLRTRGKKHPLIRALEELPPTNTSPETLRISRVQIEKVAVLLAEEVNLRGSSRNLRIALMDVLPRTVHARADLLTRAFGSRITNIIPLESSAEIFAHRLIETLKAQRMLGTTGEIHPLIRELSELVESSG